MISEQAARRSLGVGDRAECEAQREHVWNDGKQLHSEKRAPADRIADTDEVGNDPGESAD